MHIVVAEEDTLVRRTLETALTEWGHRVQICKDGSAAVESLLGQPAPDCALLSWTLKDVTGMEICRVVRNQPQIPTYLVLMADQPDPDHLVAALELGADDYLAKPLDAGAVRARLKAGQRVVELRREVESARELVRQKTAVDAVTGILNRATLMEMLVRECARARREGAPLGLALVDIDDFTVVNDTLGHQAGDAVLRDVATRLKHCIRPYDALGRYGGDAFAVMLPGCDLASAGKLAERLRAAVATHPVKVPEGAVSLSVSIGVAASGLRPDQGTPEGLLRAAEAAMSHTRGRAKNDVAVAASGSWLDRML